MSKQNPIQLLNDLVQAIEESEYTSTEGMGRFFRHLESIGAFREGFDVWSQVAVFDFDGLKIKPQLAS